MYSHKKPFSWKIPSLPALLIGLVMFCIAQQSSADDYFNPALLDIDNPQQAKTDLSIYEKGPGQAPGKYLVSIFINNTEMATRDVTFTLRKAQAGNSTLQPCFSLDELKKLGIKTSLFPQLTAKGGRFGRSSRRDRHLSYQPPAAAIEHSAICAGPDTAWLYRPEGV